jgi:hypothetical protein
MKRSHRLLPRLYPAAWRRRYAEEFAALLEHTRLSPGVVLDILGGALDAWLHPEEIPSMAVRYDAPYRGALITVFCAYIAFVVAGLALVGLVDDSPFVPAMDAHLGLRLAWMTVAAGSVVALAAVVLGALPLAVAVVRHALAARRVDLLKLLAVPLLALLTLGGYAALVALIGLGWLPFPWTTGPALPGRPLPVGNIILLAVGALLFIAAAVASTAAVCLAVARARIREQRYAVLGLRFMLDPLRFAVLPAIVAASAMGAMLAATVLWGLLAWPAVPGAFNGTVRVEWFGIVGLMGLSTLAAALAVLSALIARARERGHAFR